MKNNFQESLEKHFRENLAEVTPLQRAIREKAWSRFTEMGLPNKKLPGYQYFPFNQFYHESFALSDFPVVPVDQITPLIHPESRRSYVIFVNGQYAPDLSDTSGLPDGVEIMRLRDALANYGSFLQGRISRVIKEEKDPLATLNIAMVQMGLFLYVPPEIEIESPIQCLNLISNDHPVFFTPRLHFFLGKLSKMRLVWDYHCLKDCEYFSNSVVDIALEEGAVFEQEGMISPCKNGWVQESTRATLKRDAKFASTTCTTGTKSVRQDFHVSLLGENASCDLKGLSVLSGSNQSHINVLIDHQAPCCESNQLFKNVLSDHSKSSFEGKIYVHPQAQKTMAYQLNHNLLLSEKVIANSKPNLEIFADDVKASHGATVSQLNQELLFYLKARGIDQSTAKKLLIHGFCLDVLKEVSSPFLSGRMQKLAEKNILC